MSMMKSSKNTDIIHNLKRSFHNLNVLLTFQPVKFLLTPAHCAVIYTQLLE